ncbi:MAG: hypothetical protein ACXVQ5_06410, partial [Actinomycetota bacterium]
MHTRFFFKALEDPITCKNRRLLVFCIRKKPQLLQSTNWNPDAVHLSAFRNRFRRPPHAHVSNLFVSVLLAA